MSKRAVVVFALVAMLGAGILAWSLTSRGAPSDPPDDAPVPDDPPAIRRARKRRQRPTEAPTDPVPDPPAPVDADSPPNTTPDQNSSS